MDPLGGGDIRTILSQLGLGGASQPLPGLGSGYDADGNPIPAGPSPYMAQLGAAPTVQTTGGPVQAVTPVGQALAGGIADTLMAPGRAYNGQMAVREGQAFAGSDMDKLERFLAKRRTRRQAEALRISISLN